MIKYILTLILLSLLPYTSHAGGLQNQKYVSVRVIADKNMVKGGETLTIGVENTIEKDWHIYWLNPGDSGIAPAITWKGLDGLTASDISWPTPHKLPYGPLTNYGYEKKATFLQTLTLPEKIPAAKFTLNATVDLLVCKDICLPETHDVTLTLNDPAAPSQFIDVTKAQAALPVETGWAAILGEKEGNVIITVTTETSDTLGDIQHVDFFPEAWGLVNNNKQATFEKTENGFTLTQVKGDRALSEVPVSKAVMTYQNANGEHRGVRFSILTENANTTSNTPEKMTGVSWLGAAFFALLGGLILNLMPCVFPVLSIKALSLSKMGDKEQSTARLYGLAYTGGILVSFGALALTLIALKTAGAQIGWGFQLQNPVVIIILAYVLFLIGLNLSGFFEFSGRLSNVGAWLTQKHGITGSFFTGVLATIVATPCTAPFMGVAMGFALTQGTFVALTVFLAMGLGLALPYLLLCFVPTLRHFLPKPGAWMDIFKELLAFPMFASAAWLVWVLSQQTDSTGVLYTLMGMVTLAFVMWLAKVKPEKVMGKIISLIFILLGLVFVGFTITSSHPIKISGAAEIVGGDQNWENFTQSHFDELLADGYPIFVNMTAAWCITCKVNDNVAINVESTRQLFADKGIKYLKGDWTNQNPEITKFLAAYGRSGVPIYVFYGPRDEGTGKRPDPVILPQILTPDIVTNAINGTK